MAITCPQCGKGFDATLFEYGHRIRCDCGAEVAYPGDDQRGGHVAARPTEPVPPPPNIGAASPKPPEKPSDLRS